MIKGRIISLASDFIIFSFNHSAPNYSALISVVRRSKLDALPAEALAKADSTPARRSLGGG